MAEELPSLLENYVDDRMEWAVEIVTDPFIDVAGESAKIIEETKQCKHQQGWNYALCITDLSVFTGKHLVVADQRWQSSCIYIYALVRSSANSSEDSGSCSTAGK
ncbi:hypothetical protein ACE1TI_15910 [Alteribacillus sp. JSM 102045]|uniref:hypothetical protein n=1 Tax=Alteribacillus sp. JSM 102045 TaxID=1562101 RepID=UPI0035C1793E